MGRQIDCLRAPLLSVVCAMKKHAYEETRERQFLGFYQPISLCIKSIRGLQLKSRLLITFRAIPIPGAIDTTGGHRLLFDWAWDLRFKPESQYGSPEQHRLLQSWYKAEEMSSGMIGTI